MTLSRRLLWIAFPFLFWLQVIAGTLDELRKKAEDGDAKAQFELGLSYVLGKDVPKDDATAVRWYRKAADQGYAPAQVNLGWIYANGEGVTKDAAEAESWLGKAALQGNSIAQYNLGGVYASGQGVPKNPVEAYKWATLALRNGEALAEPIQRAAAIDMTPAQIMEALKLAREFKPQVAVTYEVGPSAVAQ
jgi:uncharacterized protein